MLSSVNRAEVAKFSKVGADWWRASSSKGTGPLHAMNPARVGFIRDRLAKELDRAHLPPLEQLRDVEILDVGCGGGLLSESLARLGARVTSIDPSPENIAVAERHSKLDPLTSSINYECSTVEAQQASGRSFDAVCSLEVIEHVENPLAFVDACKGCVRPGGGSLFLSTINRTAKSYAMAVLGAEHVLRLLPVGTHDWHKFVKPEELIAMVSARGRVVDKVDLQGIILALTLTSKEGMAGVGSPWSWTLSPTDHDVNYIAHFRLT